MTGLSRKLLSAALGLGLIVALASATATPSSAAGKIRIAFGDIETVETMNFLIALERAKARGVDVEVNFLKSEDIAAQAVVSGQADVGVGTPYVLIQKVKAPIRMFYQLSKLQFFPMVNTDFYKDWKDLDGQEIVVHARGSGTEAIMALMANRKGIKYSKISFVPGSEVRSGAMLKGTIKASIVDSTNMRLLMEKGGGKFKVLELGDVSATDEALYANTEFLDKNMDAAVILVEELLKTTREINADPKVILELRKKYNVAADLPADLEKDIVPYWEGAAKAGILPNNGGSEQAAKDDMDFFKASGKLQGDDLKVAEFWTFGPLEAAWKVVGKK